MLFGLIRKPRWMMSAAELRRADDSRDFITAANAHIQAQREHPFTGPLMRTIREQLAQPQFRADYRKQDPRGPADALVSHLAEIGYHVAFRQGTEPGKPGYLPSMRISKAGEKSVQVTIFLNGRFDLREVDPREAW